jgi:hypothetical protein
VTLYPSPRVTPALLSVAAEGETMTRDERRRDRAMFEVHMRQCTHALQVHRCTGVYAMAWLQIMVMGEAIGRDHTTRWILN